MNVYSTKIALAGDSKVGKSKLLSRLSRGYYQEDYIETEFIYSCHKNISI